MTKIPAFTETELWTVRGALLSGHGRSLYVPLADTAIQVGDQSDDGAITVQPGDGDPVRKPTTNLDAARLQYSKDLGRDDT